MLNPTKEPLIDFVRSRTEKSLGTVKRGKVKTAAADKPKLCGEEIRTFYESVISESSSETVAENVKRPRDKCRSKAQKRTEKAVTHSSHRNADTGHENMSHTTCITSVERSSRCSRRNQMNTLLQAAQEGDTTVISCCLKEGVDVNVQDQYGWTALMCASYSGQGHLVRLLLEHGARKDLCDKRGKMAKDLALHAGHTNIVTMIDSVGSSHQDESSYKPENGFYCEVCKCWFYKETEKSHETSTLHLFNCQLEPKKPDYLISEMNVGYQMMLKSGWNQSHGLGPDGQGRKFPVKTVLKRNRKGLGEEEESPRVTHFKPRDAKAVKSVRTNYERHVSVRVLSRRAMRRKELKERDWEKRLRQYMNSE